MLQYKEMFIILAYLAARTALVVFLGNIILTTYQSVFVEIRGAEADPALTALMGIQIGALAAVLSLIGASIAVSILDYLKDPLVPRRKAEEDAASRH